MGTPTNGPGANDVTFPVNVDPGTDTGTFVVEVASPAAASIVASGAGWDCPPAAAGQPLTLSCSSVVGSPAARAAAKTATALPELLITATSNEAGVLTVRTLAEGTLIDTTEVAFPEVSAQLGASVRQSSTGPVLVATVAGRFPVTPTFWIWWSDPSGVASTAGLQADTSDAWRCNRGADAKPSAVPADALRCTFDGDGRVLSEVRTFAVDDHPHTVHWILQVGSVTSEITLDYGTA